jgi:hypothetical protein
MLLLQVACGFAQEFTQSFAGTSADKLLSDPSIECVSAQ